LVAFGALGLVAAIGFELRLPSGALRVSSCFLLVMNAAVLAFAGHSALDNLGHPEGAALWIGALALAHLTLALLVGRLPRVAADIRLVLLTLGVLLGDVAFALLAHGTVLATGLAGASVLFGVSLQPEGGDRVAKRWPRLGSAATSLVRCWSLSASRSPPDR